MAVENNKDTVVDSRFFVPPGVVDVRQQNKNDGSYIYQATDIASDATAPILTSPGSTVPMPTGFTVVEQRVRISPDGKSVVDVILEFPDLAGIRSVEVRVSKA